jgi:GH25 family lysozyme M1 (1,4-beta-N-acetylmuramidase)
MNSKRQTKMLLTIILVLAALLLAIIIIGSIVFFRFGMWKAWTNRGSRFYTPTQISQIKEDAYVSGEDAQVADIRQRLEGGTGINAILRQLYPDSFIYTVNGRYYFTPINYSLKMNSLNNDCFIKDDETGEITYSDGTITSHKGIDVSKYQGTIDWSKVKASGVEYAIIRCGYRGYESGTITQDSSFDTYARNALANDVGIGAYFYTQAINADEAREEADFVISCLKPYNATYPICLDVEDASGDGARQDALSNSELTDVVIAFCERIKEAGYTPMIYANGRYFAGRLEVERLEDYDKWYAMYADTPYMPYEISMWQYSSSGTVDGITGNVDMNISFKTW